MELVKDKKFGGERPLFAQHDLRLENVTITDGESGINFMVNILGGMLMAPISRTAISHSTHALPSGTPTTW